MSIPSKKIITISQPLKLKRKKLVLDDNKEKDLTDNPPKNLVFIDASFFTFYRYHATKVWYCQHTKTGDEADCNVDNELFLEKFIKHFNDLVSKIVKKFKADEVYWFKDAPRSTIWRMPMAPDYKDGRQGTPGIGAFFEYVFTHLVPNDKLFSVDNAEADDLIAVATKYENTNSKNKVVIISGDSDLLQLVNNKTRLVKPPKLEDIPLEIKLDKKTKMIVSPQEYLEIKIIVGDKSDNISKVYAGCGPKTSYDIATDPTRKIFQKLIADHPDRLAKYQHNQQMICFDHIPTDLANQILKTYLDKRVD